MSRHGFVSAPQPDWFTVEEAGRIYGLAPDHIQQLVQSGRLRSRQIGGEVRIDSNSLDRCCEDMPVPVAAPARTYVMIAGIAYEEVATASGTTLIPV